jgi:hypothetical protein
VEVLVNVEALQVVAVLLGLLYCGTLEPFLMLLLQEPGQVLDKTVHIHIICSLQQEQYNFN